VKMFLESDCTHLFFIDSDLKWEARAFLGLLMAGRPVAAGVYRRRQEPEDYPVKYVEDERVGLMINDGWADCLRVPTGFLCIERKVIEEMAADAEKMLIPEGEVPRLFYTKVTEDRKFMGEDYCWCDDYVERYGKPIEVFVDLNFKHDRFECNWLDFLKRKSEEFYAANPDERPAEDAA